ncbi:MAG: hypothetical protein K8I60_13755, partial [Anaerolineae bacterium]|nr:hypothetical protein [Anaerolineae bacterium]
MAQESIPVQYIEVPDELLSPREARLARAAAAFRWGAILNGGLFILILLLALVAGLGWIQGLFPVLHSALLGRVTGADDAAAAGVILLIQLNIGALLLLMVGMMARELWALLSAWLLVILNVAG